MYYHFVQVSFTHLAPGNYLGMYLVTLNTSPLKYCVFELFRCVRSSRRGFGARLKQFKYSRCRLNFLLCARKHHMMEFISQLSFCIFKGISSSYSLQLAVPLAKWIEHCNANFQFVCSKPVHSRVCGKCGF